MGAGASTSQYYQDLQAELSKPALCEEMSYVEARKEIVRLRSVMRRAVEEAVDRMTPAKRLIKSQHEDGNVTRFYRNSFTEASPLKSPLSSNALTFLRHFNELEEDSKEVIDDGPLSGKGIKADVSEWFIIIAVSYFWSN
jgi:hypothetical protein